MRKARVSVLKDGAAVAEVLSNAGTGYMEYEAVVVSTIKNANRGLESARYVEMARRRDLGAAAEAASDSVDEASSGNGISAIPPASASCFNRFLRRCGGSAIAAFCGSSIGAVKVDTCSETLLLCNAAKLPLVSATSSCERCVCLSRNEFAQK